MRRYRMGLIQTPDQLRFSYLAIIEGSHLVLDSPPIDEDKKMPGLLPEEENAEVCCLRIAMSYLKANLKIIQ